MKGGGPDYGVLKWKWIMKNPYLGITDSHIILLLATPKKYPITARSWLERQKWPITLYISDANFPFSLAFSLYPIVTFSLSLSLSLCLNSCLPCSLSQACSTAAINTNRLAPKNHWRSISPISFVQQTTARPSAPPLSPHPRHPRLSAHHRLRPLSRLGKTYTYHCQQNNAQSAETTLLVDGRRPWPRIRSVRKQWPWQERFTSIRISSYQSQAASSYGKAAWSAKSSLEPHLLSLHPVACRARSTTRMSPRTVQIWFQNRRQAMKHARLSAFVAATRPLLSSRIINVSSFLFSVQFAHQHVSKIPCSNLAFQLMVAS